MNLVAKCMEMTKSPTAAMLLQRIAYWQGRATICRDNRKWIAKDGRTWRAETGLSADQYKAALAVLKKRNLIDTRQGLFGNRNITHISLTSRAIALLDRGAGTPPEKGEIPPLYVQGDTEGSYDKEKVTTAEGAAGPDQEFGSIDTGEEDVATVAEIIAGKKYDAKKTAPKPGKHAGGHSLEMAWKATIAETYAGQGVYVGPMLAKDVALLTKVAKMYGADAPAIMAHALRNWVTFTQRAEVDAGAYKTPALPALGFFWKYRDVARAMWINDGKPIGAQPAAPTSVKSPVQSIAPKPVVAPVPQPEEEDEVDIKTILSDFHKS